MCKSQNNDLPVGKLESMKGYSSKHVSLSSHLKAPKKELLASAGAIVYSLVNDIANGFVLVTTQDVANTLLDLAWNLCFICPSHTIINIH